MTTAEENATNGGISFNDDPPEPGPELWIHRLKAREKLTCTILAVKVRGVDTHWVAGRTQPHFKDKASCPGCIARVRIDWKGYLHVFSWEKKREIFLELTPASKKSLYGQVAPGIPLRGMIMRVERTAADNGRLIIGVDKVARRPPETLPPEKDPMVSILKLWGVEENPPVVNGVEPRPQEEPDYELEPPPDAF